ncbi:hypothetical protein [uncultured Tolumonas sp.]|uniref:hypothetical protein n=1 Tax=uncultured Tolumonas sp. TaxID=263765 RepID=UPI00292EB627|nr:hypothetical protein [uncultured Tolumonas sp.]
MAFDDKFRLRHKLSDFRYTPISKLSAIFNRAYPTAPMVLALLEVPNYNIANLSDYPPPQH